MRQEVASDDTVEADITENEMFGLSVRSLLAGLFLLLTAVIFGQGLLAIAKVAAMNDNAVALGTNWLPSVDVVREMNTIMARLRTIEGRILMAEDAAELQMLQKNLTGAHEELTKARARYEPLIASPEERETYQQFASNYSNFQNLERKVVDLLGEHKIEEARKLFRGELFEVSGRVGAPLAKLVELNVAGAKQAVAEAGDSYASARFFSIMTLVIAGAIGVAATIFSVRGIAYPITRIAQAMRTLAGGDVKVEIPYVNRRDEIGSMAQAVEVFKQNAVERIRLESQQKETEARSAEARKADMRRLADEFQAAVGQIVDTVSSASNELEAAAGTLTKTAEETQNLAGSVAAASEEASSNVESVASATEEMTSSVHEISRQVQESAKIASDAVHQAEQTDVRINELSNAAARIGDVVKLITAIAEQTNLLALNATIEAARAGEAGRGFAVVASEVKALAAQTAKATEEIGTQIASMQTATQDSVGAIKEISTTIGRIAEIAETIASAVHEQGAATQEIARNVGEAAKGTSQVAHHITSVNRGASETGSASAQVLASARSLSKESSHLKTEVQRFLASVRTA
jgi:methyl-accepting chemotaxis protein